MGHVLHMTFLGSSSTPAAYPPHGQHLGVHQDRTEHLIWPVLSLHLPHLPLSDLPTFPWKDRVR